MTTRVMGTFGLVLQPMPKFFMTVILLVNSELYGRWILFPHCSYVAPEYASTGMLNERSDVYSFGVLIMEIISGRTPVDYTKPLGDVALFHHVTSSSFCFYELISEL